jgi:hypothetical protein
MTEKKKQTGGYALRKIPVEALKTLKISAVNEGITLQDIIIRALETEAARVSKGWRGK